jgi:hypothetical protein
LKTRADGFCRKYSIFFLLLLSGLPYSALLLPAGFYRMLLREDGVFETASACLWLISSGLCFYLYSIGQTGCDLIVCKTRRNIFLLLLALVFFFGFGEEISWGQRIFGVQTPEPLREINEQGELNIHNLAGFHVEQLFSLFWFSYAFVAPLVIRLSRRSAALAVRLNLPLIPFWIGLLFPVNYLVSKLFQPHFTGAEKNFPIEAKEFGFALLFLAASLSFITDAGARPEENG